MQETTKNKISELFAKEQKNFIDDVTDAGQPVEEIFEALVKVLCAQEKEYAQLLEVPGFLPKEYAEPVGSLIKEFMYDSEFLVNNSVKQLELLLSYASSLTAHFMEKPPVFVQQKLTVGGKELTHYVIERKGYMWDPEDGFFPATKLHFPSYKCPNVLEATLKAKRIPLTHELLLDLINRVLEDDNWQIEEADPVEHSQRQVFQKDKAFGPLFENAQ